MSDIQEGEYVRTINGGIGKYTTFGTWVYLKQGNKRTFEVIENCDITKHSSNIIDLIEEGDYVNGYKIYVFNIETNRYGYKYLSFYYLGRECAIFERDIKSIVTKERFEESEYKVNE